MFEGSYTAIVTPFRADGSIDFEALDRHVEFQIEGGVTGLVPVGTTGESPTLNFDDHHAVIERVIKTADKRVKVIAGTGGNSTDEALELTAHARDAGADGTLQVTPYYNKPTDRGLTDHFAAVADLGLPVMLYNVPGRSGIQIPLDVVVELAAHEHVVAVKEAAGSVARVSQILDRCEIDVLSGDDPLTLPMMIVGAVGVVSVASNVVPAVVANMVKFASLNMWQDAAAIHREYYGLFSGLFMETNPIPVKTALAMMGHMEESFRLPMCPLTNDSRVKLRGLLETYELI